MESDYTEWNQVHDIRGNLAEYRRLLKQDMECKVSMNTVFLNLLSFILLIL